MKGLDRHILGLDDPKAPFNRDDPEVVEWFSDCCGATMTGLQLDYGICPDCKEPCVIMVLLDNDEEMKLEDL